jgi:DNA-binding transcriptional ArsR family regulator
MKKVEQILKALANKRRLAILIFLALEREASVGEIADHLHISMKATSRHLAILAHADILDREHRSKEVYYALVVPTPATVKHVLSLL